MDSRFRAQRHTPLEGERGVDVDRRRRNRARAGGAPFAGSDAPAADGTLGGDAVSMTERWKRKAAKPLLDLWEQGVTPEAMALSIALGFALGVVPAPGCATLFCSLAALALRLNLPAIQCVNYLVYPLQITLLAPFLK